MPYDEAKTMIDKIFGRSSSLLISYLFHTILKETFVQIF